MSPDHFEATYLIETPHDPAKVAEVIAGEQSCGTFTRVAGETDDVRARARASTLAVEHLETVNTPSLSNALLERLGNRGPWHRARVTLQFPTANTRANLPTLVATVCGNLYDLGEVTGLRLESVRVPDGYRRQFDLPKVGIEGTRAATGVRRGALVGTIIKPSVGLTTAETAALVAQLCAAGIDVIKDDEVSADSVHAPMADRVPAVMRVIREHAERTGKQVMYAFNITDEVDAMRRHADLVAREGGSCVMASLNWIGHAGLQTLRRHTPLAIHGHRNGYGALSRHPLLGISVEAYQTLWRLGGVDHMHVHGLQGKFAQPDAEVEAAIADCYRPLGEDSDDVVMPIVSSGQWAGTVQATWDAAGRDDVMFMAGGGILAHPDGAAAGVTSIRQAWQAAADGISVNEAASQAPELARALDFFGKTAAHGKPARKD
ncbi:ribulose-bisphosphate carboxylase large subunit family protein [Achromobacter sp. GG226]|uniref:ribulose-bisphosphate carboxylase large subunit family protein n=1 Tax=Verticiella alkaliphila TaxID=2779529 RepID=UPI001C0AEA35|nr:ribulose-bisphosphate carboxylase large subunit family protein [Verticiella sp. GG226]MBU4610267.1 ribulose-bisphosphate carboxylase large subunit family protein [Verticiella sp. GG226]